MSSKLFNVAAALAWASMPNRRGSEFADFGLHRRAETAGL